MLDRAISTSRAVEGADSVPGSNKRQRIASSAAPRVQNGASRRHVGEELGAEHFHSQPEGSRRKFICVGVVQFDRRHGRVSDQIEKLTPQPQLDLALGFFTRNSAAASSSA